ncbi:haloacid dehalogenase superfamily, subfamily IA, variant 3 with third motif having DD or ED [Parafrankia irregularis]|uniref:Haloacid dehalogenase superfamily, subfamily IA, variant 3 with third motif having DD or ED n=1 Tax=Parafrankia irregularis TaxID=795642 RepID=A0A0S4QV43_9ACTN|nr:MULTISPECIES: HAD family phosphatase [Parafrankia]MBE3201827.1 HAD family phosphatase [Parafrankia sp. CH37]CUU58310.1 haloacid dehalogenase superfamily, subfamily IA, variant 3 with third motif having DD or ED [Parafrankia irregularis]
MSDLPAAVLLDMDGLLVDTEPLWTIAEHEAAARLGREFTPEMKQAMIGHGIDTAVPIMLEMLGAPAAEEPATAEFLLRRSAELFREPGAIIPQPGAPELLGVLTAAGVPTALVSSSFRSLVDPVVALLGARHFTVTVAGDEVERRKPHPDPYLAATRLLGVDPAACVVLEDSLTGAAAGVAAGCVTVLVPSMPIPAGQDLPPVQARVANLHEVDLALLAGLVRRSDAT